MTPDKRRSTLGSSSGMKRGSFVEEYVPKAPETEEQRAEREKKEFKDSFRIMSKEESHHEMKKKDFDEFLARTGRIMERALDQDVDIIGDFFKEDDEQAAMMIK